MSTATPTIADFSRGELSPLFDGRVDLPQIYGHGLALAENVLVRTSGAVTAMPGTRKIAEVKDSTRKVRIYSFVASPTKRYFLEIGHHYIRFFINHAPVLSAGVPFEVATNYDESELLDLDLKARLSVLYIAHGAHKLATLTWSGTDTGWVLADFAFAAGSVDFTSAPAKYPRSITFRDGRMILGGTAEKPLTEWGSMVADYTNFDLTGGGTVTQSTAWEFPIGTDINGEILWTINLQDGLLVGTTVGEVTMFPTSTAGIWAQEPPNITVRTNFGSLRLGARLAGENPIFVQADGETVREYIFANDTQAWRSPELSFFSSHITSGGIVDMAYQASPEQIMWLVRADGALLGLTIQRDMGVYGWHRHPVAGTVESVAVGPAEAENEISLVVKRTVGGATKRFVEYVAKRRWIEQRDAYFVDCGVTLDLGSAKAITAATAANPVVITAAAHGFSNGDSVRIRSVAGMVELNDQVYTVANAAANTFELAGVDGTTFAAYASGGMAERVANVVTGLDHLEGETVAVIADGARLTDQVVSAGSIELEEYGNTIHAGLYARRRIKLQRLEGGGESGPSQGKTKRISSVTLRFYQTGGAVRVGREDSDEKLQPVIFRTTSHPAGYPAPLFTGDYPVPFRGTWDRDAYVWIVQEDPLPFTVLAVMPEFETVE